VNHDYQSPSIDAHFSVPLTHRLRFTGDVFGPDRQVLAELLEPSDLAAAQVQFWLDSNLVEADRTLLKRVRTFAAQFAGRVTLAGEPRIAPGGEGVKNDPNAIERILAEFQAAALDRRSYVVVIGGGAVLDAVGFAAAIAHRGVRLVRLPTTTLSQADSGVGVKNGVNRFHTKNWLGVFAAPWAVVNDTRLLDTLSDRDFRAGFSEMVKVALLKDPRLFEQLCQVAPEIRGRDMAVCNALIRRSAELHLEHIVQGGDPFEMLEARPLDFGHWSAHKLEAMTDFSMRHGEAVAIGIAIDTVYSSLALGLDRDDAIGVLGCLARLGFDLDCPQLDDFPQLITGLEEFRQHLGGRLTLTMLGGIGRPLDMHAVDGRLAREAIEQVRHFARSSSGAGQPTRQPLPQANPEPGDFARTR
jgi:3-dehydroquinate synthase